MEGYFGVTDVKSVADRSWIGDAPGRSPPANAGLRPAMGSCARRFITAGAIRARRSAQRGQLHGRRPPGACARLGADARCEFPRSPRCALAVGLSALQHLSASRSESVLASLAAGRSNPRDGPSRRRAVGVRHGAGLCRERTGARGFPDAWWWGRRKASPTLACGRFRGGLVHAGPLRTTVTAVVVPACRTATGDSARQPGTSPVRAEVTDERSAARAGRGYEVTLDGCAPIEAAHVLPGATAA